MSLTRRELLVRVAHAGGYSATFAVMHSLGLLGEVPAEASTLGLPQDAGKGVKVVILGGGISGLVSAYELSKAGFQCTLLEARVRPATELDGAQWHHRRVHRRHEANRPVHRFQELLQCGAGAAVVASQDDSRILPRVRRSTRSLRQCQSECTDGKRERVRREACRTEAGSQRYARSRRGAACEKCQAGGVRRKAHKGRQRTCSRFSAYIRGFETGFVVSGFRTGGSVAACGGRRRH